MHVLLIEDNPHWQLKIEATLHNSAHTIVAIASNIAEAEQYLKQKEAPDLIIADIMLKDQMVFELLTTTNIANLPTIVISTSKKESHLAALQGFKYATLLLKPFHAHSLLAAIDTVTALATAKQALLTTKEQQSTALKTIAHDLKSPIISFMGIAKTMKFLLGQKDYETIDAIGNEIEKKSSNLSLLLSNVLHWSTNDKALNNEGITIVNLQILLGNLLPSYRDIAESKQVTIINQVLKEVTIRCHEQAIATIVRNLIDNAIKNASQNSLVNIYAQQNDSSIYFQVSNQTSTFQLDKLQALKAKLFQGSSITPMENGMGLGLALVHSNVVKLGGSIKIGITEQTVTFYVELPSVR